MPAQIPASYDPLNTAPTSEATGRGGRLPADRVARLGTNDLLLIESFFSRALDLSLETRREIAARIAEQLARKMEIDVPSGNPERFLETISYAMRSDARTRH
jgi:hypothetical protein